MDDLILLKPTEDDVTWWLDHFVPGFVLWWWDDSSIPNESHALRVLDRRDCRSDAIVGDIAYVNAFHMWAMHRDVTQIIVDDGRWISSLSADERKHVSELQVRFKRGLCIPQQRFGDDVSLAESVMFDNRVVLDQTHWASLPVPAKRSVIESELAEWDRDTTYPVPQGAADHIVDIANSFVLQEGVNCLSVTAFALTANRDDLNQWMMPDEFNKILSKSGYEQIDESIPHAGDVIVFRDDDENVVHAAYVIEHDRLLNKSGQTSFNPIAIIDLDSLQEDWSEYTPVVFRRSSADRHV